MPASPTPSEVKVTIKTLLSDEAIQQFIDDAVLMVEPCTVIATFSEAKQKAIIRYIAAHMIATSGDGTEGRMTSQKIGDASETYEAGTLGQGLKASSFGQKAIEMDTSGCLASLGKQRIQFKVL